MILCGFEVNISLFYAFIFIFQAYSIYNDYMSMTPFQKVIAGFFDIAFYSSVNEENNENGDFIDVGLARLSKLTPFPVQKILIELYCVIVVDCQLLRVVIAFSNRFLIKSYRLLLFGVPPL